MDMSGSAWAIHISFTWTLRAVVLCSFTAACLWPSVSCQAHIISEEAFDVTRYLSSSTRYEYSLKHYGGFEEELPVPPPGCRPVHVNLLVRHGTREPTHKRMFQVNELGRRLTQELNGGGFSPSVLSLDKKDGGKKKRICGGHDGKVPPWMFMWDSPWTGRNHGGSLAMEGERELYEIGKRFRRRFIKLIDDGYDPSAHPLLATKVSRTSSSAVAFGIGLLEKNGSLGECGLKSFAIKTEDSGPVSTLRFHDVCDAYKERKKAIKKLVRTELQGVYLKIAESFSDCQETELGFITAEGVEALWQLCKQQAALEGVFDQACSLFTEEQVALLDWADDFELFHTRAYGTAVNYRMAVPLVEDMLQAMNTIITHTKEQRVGAIQRAHMRFAHAETLIPLTCLLGLFLQNGTHLKDVEEGRPLPPPLPPPAQRSWRGGRVAPYASNLALVLYHCPGALSPDLTANGKRGSNLQREADGDGVAAEEAVQGLSNGGGARRKNGGHVSETGRPENRGEREWETNIAAHRGATVNGKLDKPSSHGLDTDEFKVLALHNEKAVIMPACGSEQFCPFSIFKEEVVGPHMKHTWEMTCMRQVERSATFVGSMFRALEYVRDRCRAVFGSGLVQKEHQKGNNDVLDSEGKTDL